MPEIDRPMNPNGGSPREPSLDDLTRIERRGQMPQAPETKPTPPQVIVIPIPNS
jgi:hypothetical protein